MRLRPRPTLPPPSPTGADAFPLSPLLTRLGAKVTISFISCAVVIYSVQWWNFLRLNKIRDNLSPEERQRWLDEGREGDDHPDFRYPQ